MNLNQVTVEVADIARATAFYQRLGFEIIVSADHYARFLCPGGATFSVHVADDVRPGGTLIYFECEDLDARVAALKAGGVVSTAVPQTNAGCGAKPDCAIRTGIGCVCTSRARTGSTRRGGSSREGPRSGARLNPIPTATLGPDGA